MSDINHYFGGDVGLSNIGDLLAVNHATKSQQRILRRLMTNPATRNPDGSINAGDYLWHQDYGAGLPAKIGQTFNGPELRALIRNQVLMEPTVAKTPEPQIDVQQIPGGITVAIQYSDAQTNSRQFLSFNVTA